MFIHKPFLSEKKVTSADIQKIKPRVYILKTCVQLDYLEQKAIKINKKLTKIYKYTLWGNKT